MEKKDIKKTLSDKKFHIKHSTTDPKVLLKRKRIIAVISLAVSLVLLGWITVSFTKLLTSSMNSDEGLTALAQNLKNMINSYGNVGIFVAFGIQMLQIVVSPIPGEVVEVGMGLCYGWLGGALICLLGSAASAAIIMLFVKKFGIKIVELFVSVDKINDFKFINSEKKLSRLVFLLYLLPGTPKDPLIFFFGLTRIRIIDFVIIQTIARIPSVVSSTVGGDFLVAENYLGAILIFAITGIFALVSILCYRKILAKLQERKEHKETSKEQKD